MASVRGQKSDALPTNDTAIASRTDGFRRRAFGSRNRVCYTDGIRTRDRRLTYEARGGMGECDGEKNDGDNICFDDDSPG